MPKQKQKLGYDGGRAFTVRTTTELFEEVDDYAWKRRITLGAAVTNLLLIALAIENGGKENATEAKKTATG